MTPDVLASTDFKGSGLSGMEVATRFLRASLKGWQYAVENQSEAVDIVLKNCGDTCAGSGSRQSPTIHQTWQMAEVAKLVAPMADTKIGYMDQAAFDRSVDLLVKVGLLKEKVSFADAVDTRVYDAATQ
jgi:NitT/TauT family transport system substrate-binding protein